MYIDAIFANDLVWSTKYDDMLTYPNNDVSYWTGYFSSQANVKEYIRRAQATLYKAKTLKGFRQR